MTTSSSAAAAGLSVVTSDRAEGLIERLAGDLGADPLSPFDDEIVVVQSLGMRRWLRHELARRHGCAASIRFPFPAAFCQRLAGMRGRLQRSSETGGIDARFDRDALVWRILELFDAGIANESGFEPLQRFVADGDMRKRLGLAARIAGRFDDYQLYRPETLLAWESGAADAHDSVHEQWQAALWRRLCAGEVPPMHLARWFTDAIRTFDFADGPANVPELPRRISVFGISTLPPLFVELLRAVSRAVPVRFYLLAPPLARGETRNPLFAAFGDAVRDLLDIACRDVVVEEIHDEDPIEPTTVLRRLQHDVRSGIARGPEAGRAAPLPLPADDSSLTVHICHSPMREMEVLRDQLLAAFAAEPTLRPHDILLLVPDVSLYAPFVEAVFGVGEPELPRIPHTIADRAVITESSIAEAAVRILRLVGARLTATEIIELLDVPSVRRAAGLDDVANATLLGWLRDTRIRWGRDGAMRRDQFDLPPVESNSWNAGLDRLLMGYAVGPEAELFAGVLPSSGAMMGDPETLGAFAAWTERLFDALDDCRRERTLGAWGRDLRDTFTMLIAPDDDEAESFHQLLELVDSLMEVEQLALGGRDVDVALVRDWLERRLADDSAGSGFLVGGMTVCALKPMRSIPFRVIAIAGLDDAAFPRRNRRAAYDLLEIEPRRNDRNLRADDRQLFFDTLLSARDRLILSYVGRSAKNNSVRAASVVIAELLDQVDRTFSSGGTVREAIVTTHHLQPFSAVYYGGGTNGESATKYFSFSRANARATAAASAERRAPSPFVISEPSIRPVGVSTPHVTVSELADCWLNPSRFYARRVLGVVLPGEEEPIDDCEPMSVHRLSQYGFDERMLKSHLGGAHSLERERNRVMAEGLLPSGELASRWMDKMTGDLSPFLGRVGRPVFGEPVNVDVRGNGWTLTGRIDGIVEGGRLQLRPGKRKPKDHIRAWVAHVALSAMNGPTSTRVIGLDGETRLGAVNDPMDVLEWLMAGYRAAAASPLPVFELASEEYVKRLLKEEDPEPKKGKPASKSALQCAQDKYRASDWSGGAGGDELDPYHALCWRGRDPFAAPNLSDFDKWSQVLWRPALDAFSDLKQGADA